ncbi:MAG: RNA polymerase sigma-70 factor (ECF subfamily) [Planctomycetota bacterium]|jgi:RNA polymerase sigma-70 factor (ECF subfamily)
MKERILEEQYLRYRDSGDLTALAAVFDAVAPSLGRLAQRLVGDASRADDLVQETFLTALENPAGFDASRALLPWLMGILVNRARVVRRVSQRDTSFEGDVQSDASSPQDAVASKKFRLSVERAIQSLAAGLRNVVEGKLLS